MLAKQYPETKKAVGTLKKMSLGKQIRMILEEREIYRMDVQAITDYAKQKAQEEGRAKGLEEGQAKGLEEGLAKGLEEGLAKGLEEGQAKGLEEGLAKGLTEGLEKGRAEGLAAAYREKLDTARSLKAEGFPLEIIARSLKLPLEEVEGL
jgi:flagellar biosynthesis/type III secretory pathway protein FliH